MSGGSVVHQGFPVPDPDDFCITLHPCHCSGAKGEANFPAFLNVWRQAYNIPDVRAGAVAAPPQSFAPTTMTPGRAATM
jgi:hypothetical protein